jgi:hypothetical protein
MAGSDAENQHAGPNDATYISGGPISTATIHGQRGFLRSSLMPRLYPEKGIGGKANERCNVKDSIRTAPGRGTPFVGEGGREQSG